MLKAYDVDTEIEKTREMVFLDSCRHPSFIDDIMVRFMKDGFQSEGCWVRIEGTDEHRIFGTLLNEPNQNFGCHVGDTVYFFVVQNNDGDYFCVADIECVKNYENFCSD